MRISINLVRILSNTHYDSTPDATLTEAKEAKQEALEVRLVCIHI